MDDIRDIQKGSDASKFLDTKSVRTNPFGQNVSAERAYRRAERIVAALHLLTAHIAQGEPLRASVRTTSIQLLHTLLALRDEMRATGSASFKETLALIREAISLVRLLYVAGFVSPQNAEVMADALDELGNFLSSSQRTLLSESVTFTRDELLSTTSSVSDRGISDTPKRVVIKDKIKKTFSSDGPIKPRAQAIVEILKTQGVSGIKDISVGLPEYSEKMIQRELLSLIGLGKVKKTGFKRWSKYVLVETNLNTQ